MKIYLTNGTYIECEPNQKDIEDAGVDTFNKKLLISEDKAFLLPTSSRSGSSLSHLDNFIPVEKKRFNIFKWKELKLYISSLEYNYELALLKEEVTKYKMPVEVYYGLTSGKLVN